jgi:hypothetical protein
MQKGELEEAIFKSIELGILADNLKYKLNTYNKNQNSIFH